MALNILYQGKEASRDKDQSRYKQTFYGTEAEVDSYISTLSIGVKDQIKGYLRSWSKSQKEGKFWQVEVEYSTSYNTEFNDDDETIVGKKSAQLSVRNIQVPLEILPNYLTCWNHYLISCTGMAPVWAMTAKDVLIPVADRGKYQWIKSLGEVPLEKDQTTGLPWEVAVDMQKPGVEYFDVACFVVQESAKFRSASAAGNFIKKNINKIVSPSEDFNIGGQWKFDGASINFDGKHWIATNEYTRALDQWDKDLYS